MKIRPYLVAAGFIGRGRSFNVVKYGTSGTVNVVELFEEIRANDVSVSPAATEVYRSPAIVKWGIQTEARTEQVNAKIVSRLIEVTRLTGNVDYPGNAPTILGIITAFENLDVAHRIGIDGAENPEEMVEPINRKSIKKHQVMGRGTTTDI